MWPASSDRKKLLFAHERFGALGGAESNILTTARELKQREHTVGILHGSPTGKAEAAWSQTFQHRFPLAPQGNASRVRAALQEFQPDAVYVHKMADLEVLEALLEATVPVVRMVHDHDLYCMRSYRYNYFTRRICERRASLFCVVPCCAFVARNHDSRLPLKWVSYLNKRKELRLNRRFHRMVVATRFMKEELRRNGFEPSRQSYRRAGLRPFRASSGFATSIEHGVSEECNLLGVPRSRARRASAAKVSFQPRDSLVMR
jgi:hypothetical protein